MLTRRRVLGLGLTATSWTALEAVSPDADAYACPPASLRVWPSGGGAKLDTLIRVRFPVDEVIVHRLGPGGLVLGETKVTPTSAMVILRDPAGTVLPLGKRTLPTDLTQLELTPPQALAPNTAYRIIAWQNGEDFDLGQFTTGAERTSALPAAREVERAVLVRPKNVEYKGNPGPWVSLKLRPTSGAAAPLHALYERPLSDDEPRLRAILVTPGDRITFGRTDLCERSDFSLPRSGTLPLSLRPLDEAGRLGPPAGFIVNLDRPQARGV